MASSDVADATDETEAEATTQPYVPQLPVLDAETMKVTRLYELCIIFDPAEASRTWDKLEEYVRDLIEKKHKGHLHKVDKWADSRKLTYEIKGLKRGTFMVCWFRARPETISGLDRDLRLDEKPVRHLIVAHEEEPPTVGKTAEDFEAGRQDDMKRDREYGDRDFRGGGFRDRGDRDYGDRGDREGGFRGGDREFRSRR